MHIHSLQWNGDLLSAINANKFNNDYSDSSERDKFNCKGTLFEAWENCLHLLPNNRANHWVSISSNFPTEPDPLLMPAGLFQSKKGESDVWRKSFVEHKKPKAGKQGSFPIPQDLFCHAGKHHYTFNPELAANLAVFNPIAWNVIFWKWVRWEAYASIDLWNLLKIHFLEIETFLTKTVCFGLSVWAFLKERYCCHSPGHSGGSVAGQKRKGLFGFGHLQN